MKLKIKFVEVTHLPGSHNEFKTWTFKVKHKKKVIHEGFESGPFFKTKDDAKYALISAYNIDTLEMQAEL